jgi:hypothetical protein
MVIKPQQKTVASATPTSRRSQMRTTSLILAFAFVLAGTSIAGSAETGMPGIGTFTYNGSPVVAAHAIIVAAR